jgi:hypothetical protein
MDAYFDSAIIVKLYVQETTSPDAIRLVGAYVAPYAGYANGPPQDAV